MYNWDQLTCHWIEITKPGQCSCARTFKTDILELFMALRVDLNTHFVRFQYCVSYRHALWFLNATGSLTQFREVQLSALRFFFVLWCLCSSLETVIGIRDESGIDNRSRPSLNQRSAWTVVQNVAKRCILVSLFWIRDTILQTAQFIILHSTCKIRALILYANI